MRVCLWSHERVRRGHCCPRCQASTEEPHPVSPLRLARCSHVPRADIFQCAVNHVLEFVRILDLASLRQNDARFFRVEPSRAAVVFLRGARLTDLHQESLDHIFLHPACLPKNALGVNVNMEMARFDYAEGSSFFFGFAFRGLTVRETRFGSSLGESPLA